VSDRLSYSISTLSQLTDISKSQIKKAIYSGELPAVKNGVAWLVLAEDARAYLKALPRPRMRKAQNQVESFQVAA
jgi:excisionase family DNA binding protein